MSSQESSFGSHVDAIPAAASRADLASAEELLRAAGILIAQRASRASVRALHTSVARVVMLPTSGVISEAYGSWQEAEEQHRRILRALSALRTQTLRESWRSEWQTLLPQLAAWLIVLSVGGGMSVRYGVGVLNRLRWQHEYPEGTWVSRCYWNRRFRGAPLVRYDVGVNHNWGRKAPADAMLRDQWSARWDTCVVVTRETMLTLTLTSDDASRLSLDGVLQIQNSKPARKSAQVTLVAGVHPLRVDFQEGPGDAVIRLEGLNFAGTDSYDFLRPVLSGDAVHCDGFSAQAVGSAK